MTSDSVAVSTDADLDRAEDPLFDLYAHLYASRMSGMSAGEVRALFAVASRPEVISLAGGMPYVDALPMDQISELVAKVMKERGSLALQYGGGIGQLGLRVQLAALLATEGMQAEPENIVVTAGGQQGLDVVGKIFIDPGDLICVEAPSYVGALSAFSTYEPNYLQVPLDEDGMIVDQLETALRGGARPKFVYVVPNFHNPAGVTMSLTRREHLVALCREFGIPIVEDDPYRKLRFDTEPIPSMYSMDPTNVLYLSSLSKIFAAGIRVGFAALDPLVLQRFLPAKEAGDLCPSNLAQMIAEEYLRDTEAWQRNLVTLNDTYRLRRDACLQALEAHFPPDASWTHPAGGFYVWVTLPEWADSKVLLPKAIDRHVAYVPGTAFYADDQGGNQMRIAYCYPQPDDVVEGVRRLGDLLRDEGAAARACR